MTQILQFSKQYHLIGLKGLGGSKSLDSLGVIVFDADCDLSEPNGLGLAAKAAAAEKAKNDATKELEEKPATVVVKEDSSSGQLVWTSIILIGLVSVLVIVAIFCLIRYKCCKKSK